MQGVQIITKSTVTAIHLMKKGGFNIIIHSVKVMMRDVSGMLCMQTHAIKLQLFAASRFIEAKSRRELNLELLATPSHSEVYLKFRFQVH